MKLYKFIIPVVALATVFSSCYDEKMEWGMPDGHYSVDMSEIPLSVSEQLAIYDYIKNYAAEYMPTNLIGVGLTASYYIDDTEYRQVADDNFQILTTGNEMKHDAIVTSGGTLDFTTVDEFLNAAPADMKVYGHNFIWHTQQQQSYLKSLIAPVYVSAGNPDEGRTNLIANGDFSTGIDNWSKWNGTDDPTWNETEGNLDAGCLQILNTYDTPSSQWNTQLYTALTETVSAGEPVYISYYIRTLSGAGSVRCSTQGASHYQDDQTVSTSWQRIEWEIDALNADLTGICIDLGAVANTYLIDDVVVSTDPFTEADITSSYYELKTDEEKKEALLGAMEEWIQGMLEHVYTDSRFVGWDVINEPITDDGYFRGIDNHFGGTYEVDGVTYSDSTPVESEETGLTLNWGDGHFYWGYYLGMDYAVKAFEFARKYASSNIKLFVNDYNLETSPTKQAKLIEFVDYIEQNGQTVDGIGTQMHLTASSITRDEIDAMFQTLAGTGKLIRVTELDVALGTDAPDDDALQLQSDVYQMVFESFKENVPEAQQSGITTWSLTDNSREHEYWLSDDAPNIFDASYGRKLAYKGMCDGIAGFDISTTFSGDDWVNAYDTEDEEDTAADDTDTDESESE